MRTCFLTILFLLLSSTAFAQEIQSIPPGDDKIVPLRLGQPAPFEGQLFDPATSLRWANWLKQYKLVLQIDREYGSKTCKAQTDFLQEVLVLERQKFDSVTQDYRKREADLRTENLRLQDRGVAWYQTVWFGAIVGVVVTSTAVGLGVYAAK